MLSYEAYEVLLEVVGLQLIILCSQQDCIGLSGYK